MADTMNIQHFRVKLFAAAGAEPDLHQTIPVFHRWIREKRLSETPIDVSDYLHVPAGPGVILVCHEAIYGLDLERSRLGLIYNRRAVLDGSNEAKLKQAVDAVAAAAKSIEAEPEFAGRLRFDRSQWEVVVNDRALAPNTAATFEALRPAITAVFDGMMGKGKYRLSHQPVSGELFRVSVSPV